MGNPLLAKTALPLFNQIKLAHIEPAVKQILQENRAKLAELLSQKEFSWDNLILPLEEMGEKLNRAWAPVSHLNSVKSSAELRPIYEDCLASIVEYHTELSQNEDLYRAVKKIAESQEELKLNPEQRQVLQNSIRDFRLSGVGLSVENKTKFQKLQQKLSQLQNKYNSNILDCTDQWSYNVTEQTRLIGLPEHVIVRAKQQAEKNGLQGWVLNLDQPTYLAVMQHANDRKLREVFHHAYLTRASELCHSPDLDNTQLMFDILDCRYQIANLLGFNDYAEYSLSTKMAESTEQVLNFLNDLLSKVKATGEHEYQALEKFAKEVDDISELKPWDIAYYAEQLKLARYAISEELLRPYFPLHKVLAGMFDIVKKIYGIKIEEKKDVEVWDKSVLFFTIHDDKDNLRGEFYLDLYAREHKRSGAWMDECRIRMKDAQAQLQIPVAFLTCNFSSPVGEQPSLLTHEEVLTLFHEFGHGLHHMLTKIDYPSISGINGVEWDAVELPSQFYENWAWQYDALTLCSAHYQTQERIPESLLAKLLIAKNYNVGLFLLRQLEFALFDFKLHMNFRPERGIEQINHILNAVRQEVRVVPEAKYDRFQNSFSHIFAGGYAAGYYSYLWAEVLASDAFAKFKLFGIFNPTVGKEFMSKILERGGSKPAMELFEDFMGRKPRIEAFLEQHGISGKDKK